MESVNKTDSLENFQKHFHNFGNPQNKFLHFNNAGLAPINKLSMEKSIYWARRFYEEGYFTDQDYMNELQWTRNALAKLIQCDSAEIAFFQNTSAAISQVAFSFGLKEGDEVLMWSQEFSSNLYPWKEACTQAKANLKLIPTLPDFSTPVSELLKYVTDKTKVIAISWVQFQTGAMTDLNELTDYADQKGIFVMVDAIQGIGLHDFKFTDWKVDAVVGGSHKWLTAPVGLGFLALKKEHIPKFKPRLIGSMTYGTCDDPSQLDCIPKMDATKFENSSKQILEITAFGVAVDLILKTGTQVIRNYACDLAMHLTEKLLSKGYQLHTSTNNLVVPMVNFSSSKYSNQDIRNKLSSISANCALRGPGVRLSPHAFNTKSEVDQLFQVL